MLPDPRKRLSPALSFGAGAAAVGASLTTALLYGLADYATRRITLPQGHLHYQFHTYTPWEVGLPWQDVRIPTSGGSLSAWLIPGEREDVPVIIPLAGHGGNKGDLLGIARYLWQAGAHCLLFDYRGAGSSEGRGSTLGYRETEDTLAAIDWVSNTSPGRPIGLLGYSMGGAVAIMAAARDPRVGAVVADSAFASQRSLVAYQVRRAVRMPATPVVVATDRLLQRRHGFRLSFVEPRAKVAEIAPRPLMLIHGSLDSVVPVEHAYELHAAAKEPKRLWIVEEAPHVGAYFVDRLTYCREVSGFFRDVLG